MTSHIFLKLLLSIELLFPLLMKLFATGSGNRLRGRQGWERVGVSAQDLMCYVGSSQQSRSQTDEAVIILTLCANIKSIYFIPETNTVLNYFKKNGAEHEAMYR